MANFSIERCTIDYSEAISRNNGRAFWEQPMWRMNWPVDMTRDYLVGVMEKRGFMRLLQDRESYRHQMAVDLDTRAVLGYIRWQLPESALGGGGGGGSGTDVPPWPEAQVPDVSPEELEKYRSLRDTTPWTPRTDMDELDDVNDAILKRIMAERPYIKLDYLAVAPENWGKGIATALVKSGIEAAEKLGLSIFVFAFKEATGVYRRLGFVERERSIQDDTKFGGNGQYNVYFMVYEFRRPA
ncbi:hypothetical protein B0T22DRAFT_299913 [Podospora appendiculata]|uniref:N-acetyltransferase domain-containing protein n=1 Tax=Podospora appendiculata TaxID=314037 RepID=A0AAE1C7M0_9PEZI|nr:hypothetical protein B0T22DRAFT_299913 [Podospora appendiculata]